MVRIRLFAALREAAGVPEVEAQAAPLQVILDDLGDRFGDRFAAVLGYSSVLVDGERWRDPAAAVPDGAELGPEAADVDVHGAGAAEEVVAPDLLEELGPGRDPAGPGGQEPQ